MRILIFSWRDLKHPQSGGAEKLTMSLAREWQKNGHSVSLVSSRFPASQAQETVTKIKIFRPARFNLAFPFSYPLYLIKVAFFYQKYLKNQTDIIIDQVHGLPHFTPFFSGKKVVFFPLEVAADIWRFEFSYPFSVLGWKLEKFYLKLFKKRPYLTISFSTARDLKKLGIKNVKVVLPGNDIKPQTALPQKSPIPLLVSLSRITQMKRIEETIQAFSIITQAIPHTKLIIIGTGKSKYLLKLKKLTQKLKLQSHVRFTGYISDPEKQKILSSAWLILSTSLREGWGLNIIEAVSCATPAVVYQVPGLVDSVKNNKTGIICQQNKPEEFAKEVLKLIRSPKEYQRLAKNCLVYAKKFSWQKAGRETLQYLTSILNT